jgi:hypothetical protein
VVILGSLPSTYNPMPRFSELSLSAQTAYAQLFDATVASELSRSVGSLRGSFARKTVKGREYWYFQFTDLGGTLRQVYVGPDSEPVRALLEARPGMNRLSPGRSAIAPGARPVAPSLQGDPASGEHGFFRAGGVLSERTPTYGNILGLRWSRRHGRRCGFRPCGKESRVALPSASGDTMAPLNPPGRIVAVRWNVGKVGLIISIRKTRISGSTSRRCTGRR